jgi:ATP phosphoribosyltransferase regulatory subunit HisZ
VADSGRLLALPKGFHDSDPTRTAVYQTLQREWFNACSLAGYQPVCIPPVGFADTFTTGHHAAGQKLYQFTDRRGRNLALVSDSLPAVLRLARARNLPDQRLSYCCPIFRYERRPRRHFHHLGLMEVLDRPISLAAQYRATLRLAQVITGFLASRVPVAFTITDPGLWHAMVAMAAPANRGADVLDSLRRLPPEQRPDQLREDGAPARLVRLAEMLAADPALAVGTDGRRVIDALPQAFHDRIAGSRNLADVLRRHGAEAEVDLGCLHASEFHDGPSFLLRPLSQQKLLGDGGTYGHFAQAFLGTPAAVHSAVIGLERLADQTVAGDVSTPADIAILARPEPTTIIHADRLTASLRASGIAVWDLVQTKNLEKHLRDIAALAIPHSALIGPQELSSDSYNIRDITGTLYAVPGHELAPWLACRRARSPREPG